MKLTGTTEVHIFEPRPEPVPQGQSLVRLRETVKIPTAVTVTKTDGGFRVVMEFHKHEYGTTDLIVMDKVTAVVDGLRFDTHTDMLGGFWHDLRGWGNRTQVVLNTPTPDTWAQLHTWVKIDGHPHVPFDIITLDSQSQKLMRDFAASFSQQKMVMA